jgi:hypothetical protein
MFPLGQSPQKCCFRHQAQAGSAVGCLVWAVAMAACYVQFVKPCRKSNKNVARLLMPYSLRLPRWSTAG